MHVFVLWEETRVEAISTWNLAFEIVFLYFTSSDEPT